MSTYTPAYRMTVYAPRSVDPTEATVLTPAAGAPHADAFKVATIQGLAGFQPYLYSPPRGRRGRLDVKKRVTDTGTLSVTLMDKRTATNVERWVTAFAGTASGVYNLVGLKVFIEERLTTTWAAFYTGRIEEASLDGKLKITLQLRDMGEELNQPVFTQAPHASITYASQTPLLPRGLASAFGPFPTEAALPAKTFVLGSFTQRLLFDKSSKWELRVATDAYLKHAGDYNALHVIINDGTDKVFAVYDGLMLEDKKGLKVVTAIDVRVDPDNYFGSPAFPASGTAVTVRVVPNYPVGVSKEMPILINDVHPVQLWKDMLDGKFSVLKANGAVKRPVAYDATAFANLIADTSFPMFRGIIEEKDVLNSAIETLICQGYNLSYYLDELGRVVPIDLRRKANPTITSTITDADLVADSSPDWSQVRDDAITQVDAIYYYDRQLSPAESVDREITPTRLTSKDLMQITLSFDDRTIDLGEHKITIDCKGLRFAEGERMADGTSRQDYIKRYLTGLVADYRGPFSGGAQYIGLKCLRTSNTNTAKPGTFHVVDVDAIPDPGTNRRGGARLGLCVERSEDGPSVTLGFLDMGENLSANVPSISSFVKNADDPYHMVDVVYALNAQSEPVQVQIAVAGSVPGASSPLWQTAGVFMTAGTARAGKLPAGQTVWTRVRTLPYGAAGDGLKKPSDWVVYGSSVTLDAVAAPSGLTVSSVTQTTAILTWSLGDPDSQVEVLLNVGGIPGTWSDDLIALILPPNTRRVMLHRLNGPGVTHGVAVRTRYGAGGTSTIATASFTTTSTPNVAPRPAGIATSIQ